MRILRPARWIWRQGLRREGSTRLLEGRLTANALCLAHRIQTRSALLAPQLRRFAELRTPNAQSSQYGTSTVFALSTAPGRAALAVVRISGPACERIYGLLCPGNPLPKPRRAALRALHEPDGAGKDILDLGALVLYFPAPNTTTGESVLELHTHGSPAIVRAVLAALGRCSTPSSLVRPAEPGEFTRRAFLNDRLSLPEVEALGDTLAAVTEEQRRFSVQNTSRELAARYEAWRQMLLAARGELEALIDFAEDQHFDEKPSELAANVAVRVDQLIQTVEAHEQNAMRGELLRNGIALSLIGLPNVGKSSILNQIVGRNAAIVSKEAGTTRDIIEVGIDLGGFFCRLGDTAGLRSSSPAEGSVGMKEAIGEIELEGMRRAKAQAMQSDVVVVVLSVEASLDSQGVQLQLDADILTTARDLIARGKRVVVAINKTDRFDLPEGSAQLDALTASLERDVARALPGICASDVFSISVRRAQAPAPPQAAETPGDGGGGGGSGHARFARFLAGLVRCFRDLTSPRRRPAALDSATRELGDPRYGDDALGLGATARQRALLEQCVRELRRFLELVGSPRGADGDAGAEDVDIVVAAESLRAAAECLAKITGRGDGAGDVDEVLGVVFEK